jgi:5'(3')-deoxyribonucleotidase
LKKVILIDMDDTIADFCRHPAFKRHEVTAQNCTVMYQPRFFLDLKPVEGAQKAVRDLLRLGYDVQIATQPVAESARCYLEKVQWIGMWFPELITKINMVQDKGLLKADFLIDDRPDKWKASFEANGGEFITFQYHKPWEMLAKPNGKVWSQIVYNFSVGVYDAKD